MSANGSPRDLGKIVGVPARGAHVAWMARAAAAGAVAAFVPVTVQGERGVAHAAFTDHDGPLTVAARSPDMELRACAAIQACHMLRARTQGLGADA